ncbi:ubiquinone biosynthesis protein [Labrys wisconsinensis]|uniref:Ubiquinone biosynthesis protein n=1 Tax=Labrys wisconsinensis TaxID=425677 RepID=A0ABU0J7Q4_9HYPH|nr:2-polyprenylphenol 6-hydroxylase [Labrys wisconsinensis]MDQ0470304.1 ubiquinone biosynthesis protein [Labrys wisconsinensis]
MASLFDLLRLTRAGWMLAREGALGLAEVAELPGPARLAIRLGRVIERRGVSGGKGLARALTRLGPSWVKLGQFLATRPDVVGIAVARDLETLQDRMAPFPQEVAVAEIEKALGGPLASLFAELSTPVAAASVAQVHKATVRDEAGERFVAVKVLRPGIARRFRRDLSTFYFAARMIERLDPRSRRLRPVEVVDTLARTTAFEMDFRLEAAALSEMAENITADPDFRIPAPDWNRTARTVLTLEWIDGRPLSDVPGLAAAGLDLKDLGRIIIQSFLRHAIRDGFFHADMHQGNLMIDAEGKLVAVDFGIMGRAGLKERRFLAEILHGFITRNYRRVAEVHFEAGYVPGTYSVDDFAQAIRAIGEPIHQKRADEISMAKLLTLLFEVTELFDMKTRPELILLQKTMVVVEGVARTLDPKLDMWSTADPVVREWIERHLGPAGRLGDLGTGTMQAAKAFSGLPALLARTQGLAERLESAAERGFTLDPASVEAIGRAEARRARWGNRALWVIAAALVVLAWRLA